MRADARLLRSFVVVAAEGNLSRAARRLYISQPSLSQQMRTLEASLGVRLLERHPRGVTVTRAGDELLAAISEPLERLDAAVTAVAAGARVHGGGVLVVGFVGSAANELTTPILSEFSRRRPGVDVELRRFDISDPSAGLLDAHVGVAFVRDLRGHALLESAPLLCEPRVWVLPAGHRLAGRDGLRDEEVADEPGISFERALDPAGRAAWRERRHRPGRPVGGVARNIDEWLALVAGGRGISTAPASAARFFARPGLAFVAAPDAEPSVVSVAWRRGRDDDHVAGFVAAARAVADGWPHAEAG